MRARPHSCLIASLMVGNEAQKYGEFTRRKNPHRLHRALGGGFFIRIVNRLFEVRYHQVFQLMRCLSLTRIGFKQVDGTPDFVDFQLVLD